MKDTATSMAPLGTRIRAARKMAGLSLADVASRINGAVTRQAINKYEKGLMRPSPDVQALLEKALDVKPPTPVPPIAPAAAAAFGPGSIRFREGEKLSAKSDSMLRHRTADHLERAIELDSLLGTTVAFENPLPPAAAPPSTSEAVEAAAEEVRRRWELGLGPIVNLAGVIEERGIAVYETSGVPGFEGVSGMFGRTPFIALSRDFPADRRRFTAAHELAHLLCGFPDKAGCEALCHRFAGAFLLPRRAVERLFGPVRRRIALEELAAVKRTYGISLQAIMYRALALGVVGERQFRSFREAVRARGWIVTEPVEYAGPEEGAVRFRRLVRYAVVSGILELERAADLAGVGSDDLKVEMTPIF